MEIIKGRLVGISVNKPFVKAISLLLYGFYSYANLLFRLIISPKSKSLDREIFLITGSGSGIGREVAYHLAKNHPNTTLVLWDSSQQENEKTLEWVKDFGIQAFAYTVDVTNRQQVEITSQIVAEEVGHVTILFNNAGVCSPGSVCELNPESIERTVNVNLTSHFWTIRAFLPKMIERNHGHIVTTCSVLGYYGCERDAPYCASKYGLRGSLESIKSEIRHHPKQPNIYFTTIFPWFVKTPLVSKVHLKIKFVKESKLEVKYVGEKIVEGILQNQENVFIPRYMEFLLRLKNFAPKRLVDAIEDYMTEEILIEK